jgi:hypothetical protein
MKYFLYVILASLLFASMVGCENGERITHTYKVCHIPPGEKLDVCGHHIYEEIL